MKFGRNIFFTAALLAGFGAAGYWIPLRGAWLDRTLEAMLLSPNGMNGRIENSVLRRWSHLSFENLRLKTESGEPLLTAQKGNVQFYGFFLWIRSAEIVLNDITAAETLTRQWSLFIPSDRTRRVHADEIRLTIRKFGKTIRIHPIRLISDDVRIDGGSEWKGGVLVQAHLSALLSEKMVLGLPKELQKRFSQIPSSEKRLRLVYRDGNLEVLGPAGPLLKAEWKRPAKINR